MRNLILQLNNPWVFWPALVASYFVWEKFKSVRIDYRSRKQADREREIDYRVQLALKNQTKKADR